MYDMRLHVSAITCHCWGLYRYMAIVHTYRAYPKNLYTASMCTCYQKRLHACAIRSKESVWMARCWAVCSNDNATANEHVLWIGFKTRGKPCVHAAHASRYYEMYSFYLLFMCTRCFNYMVTKRSNYPIAVYKV